MTLDQLLVMNLILINTEDGKKIITWADIHDTLGSILPGLKEKDAKLPAIRLRATVVTIVGTIEGKVRMQLALMICMCPGNT